MMEILLTLVVGVVSISWLMAYHRLPLWSWTLVMMGSGWAIWWFVYPGIFILVVMTILTAGLILLIILPARRILVTRRAFEIFRNKVPVMSETERQALEAGDTWWDGELFTGKPNWKSLLNTPAPKLTKEEQDFLDGPSDTLCQMVNDWQITHHERRLPDHVWNYMRSQRFFGMIIPKKYGGLEFSALAHSSVVMKLASRSVSAAVTVMVPNSLGPAELLLRYGTEEQKEYYLPRLANGEEIPCFALTGPEAGSDASSIPDTGVVCHGHFDGQDNVLGIRLNWKKRYITLAPVATLLGLAFRLQDPENLLGKGKEPGITCALIPTGTPGVEIGRRHYPLNIAFQNGPVEGHEVFIPVDWIIGGAERAGQGWQMLMESLAAGRSISLPALSTAAGKTASRMTGAYARIREQFGMPIGKFEGIEAPLARIAANAYMMDAARTMTLGALDNGHHPSVISAIIKHQLTERMRVVINLAMDIHGGSGICMGPRNLFGRVYQSLPIAITVEGANILTRSLIIFGQGAIRCHPYIYREMKTAKDSDHKRALREFDHLLFRHLGMIISNASRALWLGLTNGRTAQVPAHGASRRYLQQLDRMSAAFALVADASMLVLGGALKRKEHLSARLADVFSLLYMTSATIKRFEDQGKHKEDIPLLRTSCHESFYTMQEQLYGVIRNFPIPLIAFALRWLVFPRGKAYSAPYDQLLNATAKLLLSPSASRDRLTEGIFISRDSSEQTGRIEEALDKIIAAEDAEKKMKQAIRAGKLPRLKNADHMLNAAEESGLFDDREIQLLRTARIAKLDVIQVDDFTPDLDLESHQASQNNRKATILSGQRKLMA